MLNETQSSGSNGESGVGPLIQQWRLSKRMSLRTLAARAGISHTTLGRWEAGRFQPCLPELEATLNALNATLQQRRQTLERLNAPRAILQVQQDTSRLAEWLGGKTPVMGDLLCAMRRRRNKTQAEIAAGIGITASTLCRWERGETWPAAAELQTLCYVLNATESEITALMLGRFEPKTHEAVTVEELATDIEHLRWWYGGGREDDLKYLTLEAQLWRCAGHKREGLPLFVAYYAYRADYLSWWERFDEAGHHARRALELAERCSSSGNERLYAAIAEARALVYSGKKVTPERGIETLRLWLPEVAGGQPIFHAWMLSDMGKYADLNGDTEAALRYSSHAFNIAQRYTCYGEAFVRGYDYATLLLKSSCPQEALPLLHPVPDTRIQHYARPLLTATSGALTRNSLAEAHQYLQRATKTITAYQIEHLVPAADQLALQLLST